MPLAVNPPHYAGDTAARLRLLLTIYQGSATDAAIESGQPDDAAAGRATDRGRLLFIAANNMEAALVTYVWRGVDPVELMTTRAQVWYAAGTGQLHAWLLRVADHVRAWLTGEDAAIPESADLCGEGEERGR